MPLLSPLAVSIAIAIASRQLLAVSVKNTDFLTAIALAVPLTMLQSLLAVTIVALYYWLHRSIGLIITYCYYVIIIIIVVIVGQILNFYHTAYR